MGGLLWTIAIILIAVWIIGLVLDIAGGLIHILLVIALIVIVYRLVTGKKVV